MGVDVGAQLNVVIRERVVDDGMDALKALFIDTVSSFKKLIVLIKLWKPKIVIIDAQPEIHEVIRLKIAAKNVFSCRFQKDLIRVMVKKKIREVAVDRTATLDAIQQAVDQQVLLLPAQADLIEGY